MNRAFADVSMCRCADRVHLPPEYGGQIHTILKWTARAWACLFKIETLRTRYLRQIPFRGGYAQAGEPNLFHRVEGSEQDPHQVG